MQHFSSSIILRRWIKMESWICFGALNKSASGTKQRVSIFLKSTAFMDEEFLGVSAKDLRVETVGTHSIRRFALTYASRSGCTHGNMNVRGRWYQFKQMVDTYIWPRHTIPGHKDSSSTFYWRTSQIHTQGTRAKRQWRPWGRRYYGPVLLLRHERWPLCRSSIGWLPYTRGFRISWDRLRILSTRSLW